jgi:hypothetical protein
LRGQVQLGFGPEVGCAGLMVLCFVGGFVAKTMHGPLIAAAGEPMLAAGAVGAEAPNSERVAPRACPLLPQQRCSSLGFGRQKCAGFRHPLTDSGKASGEVSKWHDTRVRDRVTQPPPHTGTVGIFVYAAA